MTRGRQTLHSDAKMAVEIVHPVVREMRLTAGCRRCRSLVGHRLRLPSLLCLTLAPLARGGRRGVAAQRSSRAEANLRLASRTRGARKNHARPWGRQSPAEPVGREHIVNAFAPVGPGGDCRRHHPGSGCRGFAGVKGGATVASQWRTAGRGIGGRHATRRDATPPWRTRTNNELEGHEQRQQRPASRVSVYLATPAGAAGRGKLLPTVTARRSTSEAPLQRRPSL